MIESNQKTPQDNPNPFDDRIDLRELFQVLWKGAIVIILITSAVAISSIVYSLQLTNYYQSESILLVRNNAQNQGTLSQYSGVASMIGVKGLGIPVLQAVSNQYLALGLMNGLAIVALAIIFDRVTQRLGKRLQKHGALEN